jgi:hypothetical protein
VADPVVPVLVLQIRVRWRTPAKHDVVGVYPAHGDPEQVYIVGLDNELLACSLSSRPRGNTDQDSTSTKPATHNPVPAGSRLHHSHHMGIRADSRWVGVAYSGAQQAIAGLSDQGTLYVVHQVNHMLTGEVVGS